MTGDVSTKNNGGFIQFRSRVDAPDSDFEGVRIKTRGNGETYEIHLRTPATFLPWQYYESAFQATEEWTTIELPFTTFKKSNFYQPSSVSSQDIKTIGIVAIGREFKAQIDLASIELY